jgi:hypothetical protein
MLSCVSESFETLARFLSRLGVRSLVWERAGRVAGSIVELASWRTGGGGGRSGRRVIDGVDKGWVYDFLDLRLLIFAWLGRGHQFQKGADLVSGRLIHIGAFPLANCIDHPSGSGGMVSFSGFLFHEDNGVCRLQVLGPVSLTWDIWVSASRDRDSVGRMNTICLDQVRVQIVRAVQGRILSTGELVVVEMSRVRGWVAAQIQLLLLDLLRVMDSHTNIVVVKGHVRLLNESVLGWLAVSGDWLLGEIGAELVHGLFVPVRSGCLILIKFCLRELRRRGRNGGIILLAEAAMKGGLIQRRFHASNCRLGFAFSFHRRSILALPSWLLLRKFIAICHYWFVDRLSLAI